MGLAFVPEDERCKTQSLSSPRDEKRFRFREARVSLILQGPYKKPTSVCNPKNTFVPLAKATLLHPLEKPERRVLPQASYHIGEKTHSRKMDDNVQREFLVFNLPKLINKHVECMAVFLGALHKVGSTSESLGNDRGIA